MQGVGDAPVEMEAEKPQETEEKNCTEHGDGDKVKETVKEPNKDCGKAPTKDSTNDSAKEPVKESSPQSNPQPSTSQESDIRGKTPLNQPRTREKPSCIDVVAKNIELIFNMVKK